MGRGKQLLRWPLLVGIGGGHIDLGFNLALETGKETCMVHRNLPGRKGNAIYLFVSLPIY